jgi:hypothetical protein
MPYANQPIIFRPPGIYGSGIREFEAPEYAIPGVVQVLGTIEIDASTQGYKDTLYFHATAATRIVGFHLKVLTADNVETDPWLSIFKELGVDEYGVPITTTVLPSTKIRAMRTVGLTFAWGFSGVFPLLDQYSDLYVQVDQRSTGTTVNHIFQVDFLGYIEP